MPSIDRIFSPTRARNVLLGLISAFMFLCVGCTDEIPVSATAGEDGRIQVAIVLSDGMTLDNATAAFDIFKHAGEERSEVYFVAAHHGPISMGFGARLYANYTFDEAPPAEVLVVPGDVDPQDGSFSATLDYIREQSEHATWVTGHGEGVRALARIGAIRGRKVVAAPELAQSLAAEFPGLAEVRSDARILVDEKLVTSIDHIAAYEAALHVIDAEFGVEQSTAIAEGLVFTSANTTYARNPVSVYLPPTLPPTLPPATTPAPARPRVAIMIMDGLFISEAVAPWSVYRDAGESLEVYFVAETMDPITTYYGARLVPDYSFASAPLPDVLVVPSGSGSMDIDLMNAAQRAYITHVAAQARFVTSHCWGAFALAGAGVVDGHTVTTFPGYFDELRLAFPTLVNVVETSRVVHSGNVITSNGGLAAFEGSLYVLIQLLGPEFADGVAQRHGFLPENLLSARTPHLAQ